MKTVEIIGYNRANLGKRESRKLRLEGNAPCVVYGHNEQIHFHSPMILFRDIVYTNEARFVNVNIEGVEKLCVLQDVQFHPVNEMILHADFLELSDKRQVKMEIPVKLVGTAPGVITGGKLVTKMRKVTILGFPKDLPDFIEVDVSKLELGKSVKVNEIKPGKYDILTNPLVSVATVEIPRSLRGAKGEADTK
jgi:large subunit ribosomal protein L25